MNHSLNDVLDVINQNIINLDYTDQKFKNKMEKLNQKLDKYSSQYINDSNNYDVYLNKIDNLIGLSEIKNEIQKIIDYLVFVKKVNNTVKFDNINLNIIFRGNPGTGKTTIARILSEILSSLGFSNGKFIETTSCDFIAEYIGQTAIKTRDLINEYKGGIIFVDEAYSFTYGGAKKDKNFANEALTEIIKAMENKDTIFIFSGYEKEMEDFIKLNPGIKSRVGYDITFKDYTSEELMQIFLNKIKNANLLISNEALNKINEIIEDKKKEKNFGNGRMIDNLFDMVLREHASINLNENDIGKLTYIDYDSVKQIKIDNKRGGYFV